MEPEKRRKPHLKVTVKAEKAKCQHQVDSIDNCYFPFQPYPQQLQLIQSVHEVVQNNQNALIQSPTGTGKTLCMLVGVLSALVKTSKPKIYYLTRTHSQISQIIDEFKKTVYDCKVNLIASREQLCINPNFQELKGRMLDKACQEICQQKLCRFREINEERVKETLKIDELRQKGKKAMQCPFYLTKASTQYSQITIMPFNYLLDWNSFERNFFSLKDSVLIFDEAHNIDSQAEEGSSLEFTTQSLLHALREIQSLEQATQCRYLHKKFMQANQTAEQIQFCKYFISSFLKKLKDIKEEVSITNKYDVVNSLRQFTAFLNPLNEEKYTGIDLSNYEDFIDSLERIKRIFLSKKITYEYFDFFKCNLTKVLEVIENDQLDHYGVIVSQKQTYSYLRFQCLSASFAFEKIKKTMPKSIIMCSGTLGPLKSWENELKVSFATQLTIEDFISSSQIYCGVISESDCGEKFDFSFQRKNRQCQYEFLAFQLQKIGDIVPNGIVVAFSTYQLMEKAMKFCLNLKKKVFCQTKNSDTESIFKKFSAEAQENGAYLFIIMRGRFSEGINFQNQLCRCLVIVGIPFLPLVDFRVARKKAYLQRNFDKDHADQWYMTQTFKTVNQALGRVIRSQKDYGSILLVDHRYEREEISRELPKWFRQSIRSKSNYQTGLKEFFKAESWLKERKLPFYSKNKEVTAIIPKNKSTKLQSLISQDTPKKKKPKLLLKEESQQSLKEEVEDHPWNNIDYFISQEEIHNACRFMDSESEESDNDIKILQKFRTKRHNRLR